MAAGRELVRELAELVHSGDCHEVRQVEAVFSGALTQATMQALVFLDYQRTFVLEEIEGTFTGEVAITQRRLLMEQMRKLLPKDLGAVDLDKILKINIDFGPGGAVAREGNRGPGVEIE